MSTLDPTEHLAASSLAIGFATANDTADLDEFRRILAQDATFAVTIAGESAVGPIDGAADVLEFLTTALGAQQDQRRHVITNIRCARTDRGARVQAYLTIFSVADGALSAVSTGTYDFGVSLGDDAAIHSVEIALDLPY